MKKLVSLLLVPIFLMGILQLLDMRAQNTRTSGTESAIKLDSVEDGLLPDIAVRNLHYLNADDPTQEIRDPMRGDRVIPAFTIENTGEIAADTFYIQVEDLTTAIGSNDDGTLEFLSSVILVENLTAGEERDVQTSSDFFLRSQGGSHQWQVTVDPFATLTEHSEIDNQSTFRTPLPENDWRNPAKDYLARRPRMTPENVVRRGANEVNRNGQFMLETSIVNHDIVRGIDDVNDTVAVALQIDGREVTRQNVALTDGHGTLNYMVRGRDLALGEHTVSVVVDPANAVQESNERNNTTRGNLIRVVEAGAAAALPFPDLIISDITYELYNQRGTPIAAADLQRGDIIYPMVTVQNIGTAPVEGIFYVNVEDHTRISGITNQGMPIYHESGIMFDTLGVGESKTATTVSPYVLNQRTGGTRGMILDFKVDPYEYTSELREDNNYRSARFDYDHVPYLPVTYDYLPYSVSREPDNVILQGGIWEMNRNDRIRLSILLDDNDYVGRGEPYPVENVPVRVQAGAVVRNIEVDFNDGSLVTEVSFSGAELGVGEHLVSVTVNPNNNFPETNTRNNSRIFHTIRVVNRGAYEYVPMELPELALESVALRRLDANGWTDVTPDQLQRGDRFNAFVTVRNTGTSSPGLFYVIVEDHSRWMQDPITNRMVPFETGIMVNDIAPGESFTGTTVSPFLLDNTGSGGFTLRFRVDGYERVQEMNENNNFYAYTIPRETTPSDRAYFDFLANYLRRTPDNVVYQDGTWHINENETLTLALNIRNNDYVDANFLDHNVNDLPVEVRIGNITRQLLFDLRDGSSSATMNLEITGRELGLGRHEVSVIIDPQNRFAETNERNNASPDLFNDVLVSVAPPAPNLRATAARLVQIEGDQYYPVITILNDSDLPVETRFNTIIHNKADFRGLNEDGTLRYGKTNLYIDRLDPHASTELSAQNLAITVNDRARNTDVWVQVDRTGFGTFDDVDESNETDNESFFNIGQLAPAPVADNQAATPTPEPAADPIADPATPPAPTPSQTPAPKPAANNALKPQFTLTTKLAPGVKSIKGTCTSSILDSPKFIAYVNGKAASTSASCKLNKFELKLKVALKAKDTFLIETTKGKTKTKSEAVTVHK